MRSAHCLCMVIALRRALIAASALASAVVLRAAHAQAAKAPKAPRTPSATRVPAQTDGEYLARAGDCIACHTARGGEPFAGGLEMPTPFGTLYTPNITPDPETGHRQMDRPTISGTRCTTGKSRDGSLLYPAFPYPSYTKVTRADADAIYGYLWTHHAGDARRNTPHKMQFPYNQRNLLIGWRTLYFEPGVYAPRRRANRRSGTAARTWCRASAIATRATRAATCSARR